MKKSTLRKGFTLVQRRGFTLIELLVVIAIIGILAALIIVALSSARNKATDAQLKNNARNLDTALAQYYQDNGATFPILSTAGGTDIAAGVPAVYAYLSSGSSSQAYTHSGTTAKYITDASGLYYAQAWALKNTSETAVSTGNGVYAITAAAGGTVTPGNSAQAGTLTGMTAAYASSTKAFVTYGPQ